MANTLRATVQLTTFAALDILENTLNATRRINREYSSDFRYKDAKVGATINIRKPARYLGRLGQAVNIENITETVVPLTLSFQRGVDTEVSSQELALDIENYAERIVAPKIARLANLIDQDVCSLALGLNNHVGTPGTVPTTVDQFLGSNSAKVKLDNFAAPMDGKRYVIVNPATEGGVLSAAKTFFQASDEIASQYRQGSMGRMGGFSWDMDQNVYVHTVGTLGGTPTVNGAGQSGSSIITQAWTSTTLNAGDIVSFAGVFAVNPQNYQSTGQLMQFVVTATTTDAAGAMTIPISPAIVGPGSAFQNVDALPANAAAVFVFDTAAASFANITGKVTPQNLVVHKDFGTLAMVDLPLVDGTDKCYRARSEKAGIAIRVIRDYIPGTDQLLERLDVLYGVTVLRQELGVRVSA